MICCRSVRPVIVSSDFSALAESREICMSIQEQIKAYLATQPEQKRSQMEQLHEIVLALMPGCKLWFLDGKDETGKVDVTWWREE